MVPVRYMKVIFQFRSIKDEISIEFPKGFEYQVWHHFYFVFQSFPQFPYPGGSVNLTNKAYMDGVFVTEGTRELIDTECPA